MELSLLRLWDWLSLKYFTQAFLRRQRQIEHPRKKSISRFQLVCLSHPGGAVYPSLLPFIPFSQQICEGSTPSTHCVPSPPRAVHGFREEDALSAATRRAEQARPSKEDTSWARVKEASPFAPSRGTHTRYANRIDRRTRPSGGRAGRGFSDEAGLELVVEGGKQTGTLIQTRGTVFAQGGEQGRNVLGIARSQDSL